MSQLRDVQGSRICTWLQAEDKLERKQALEEILKNVLDSFEMMDEESAPKLWEIYHRPVVRILNDQAEVCRDLAIEILKRFLLHLSCCDKNIVYIIPIMTKRLGSQELIEPSEEVRLKSVSLMKAIVLKYQDKLVPYFEDIVKILTRTVTDKYPNVKKESCECICEVARAMPHTFFSRSEVFVKPILTNISHQHYKIRMTTITTVGEVLLFGNSKSIETVSGPLAERLFDQSGAVRAAVVDVAGKWMTELKDRYSWWHKLLPLLLTGLNDIVPEIREKAKNLWFLVGEKYIEENESDPKFKEKLDFLPEDLRHYPPNIDRPNLGCRTIAQQNLCKLIPAISRELTDWLSDIKLRAAQLLCILSLYVEEDVVAYFPKLLIPMYRACNDEDKRVVENIEQASEYMGYFVPTEVICEHVLATLEENPTAGHLKVLAAMLRGSPRDALSKELPRIGSVLQKSHICRSREAYYQLEILNCCQSLLQVCKQDCKGISHDLFIAIFTTLATASELRIEEHANSLLARLVQISEEIENLNDLFDEHVKLVLQAIQERPESWTAADYEFDIFHACLNKAKSTTYKNLGLIHPIFEKSINHVDADKKFRLKQYMVLANYLQEWAKPLDQDTAKDFIEFANVILEKTIVPGLLWTAGRASEAIRTASACCLCALLNKIKIEDCERDDENTKRRIKFAISVHHFGWLFEKVWPILVTLLDDDSPKTRLLALRAISLVINIGQELSYINEEHIHKTSPEILTRLEDPHDEVRLAAIEALGEIWKVLPENYDLSFYYVHIEYAYANTLTHLDDPGVDFQKLIMDCLMDLMKVHPELLIETIEKSRANFINQKALDDLVMCAREYLKGKNNIKS